MICSRKTSQSFFRLLFFYSLFRTNRDALMDFNKIMRNKEFPIPFQQKETKDKAAQRIHEVVDVSTQTVFPTNVRPFQCQVPETYSTDSRKYF